MADKAMRPMRRMALLRSMSSETAYSVAPNTARPPPSGATRGSRRSAPARATYTSIGGT